MHQCYGWNYLNYQFIAILLVDTGRARLIRTRLIRFCEIFARFLSFHVYNAQLIQTWLI